MSADRGGIRRWFTGRDDGYRPDSFEPEMWSPAPPGQGIAPPWVDDDHARDALTPDPTVQQLDDEASSYPTDPIDLSPQQVPPTLTPVRGTVTIVPVSVGEPGPQVEPRPTAERFRSVPFRPDTVMDGWSTREATVRAASTRGHFHRYHGAPRQDDVAVHAAPSGRIIAAIADGVSAAVHSHIGASTATTCAVQWLLAEAAEVGAAVDWLELVRAVSWQIAERGRSVLGLDRIDAAQVESNFATTLVVAVIDPSPDGVLSVEVIGVGDSSGWILREGRFEPLIGGKSDGDGGLATSAVAALPRVPAGIAASHAEIHPGDVLVLGSDGIGDPLGTGHGGVGDLLRGVLLPSVPSLVEFAHATDFSRETFDDDRSLIAVWPARG